MPIPWGRYGRCGRFFRNSSRIPKYNRTSLGPLWSLKATPGAMDANSPDFLINALVDAGVWTPEQAISARAALTGFKGDANALADKFKSFGSLTSYQIRKIRHGRIVDLTVGPFVIFEKIGEGGMGKVYKALSKKIGRPVALKVVRSHLMSNKTVLRRYKREASAAAAMDHPNIVTLIDADEAGGRYFLAMEYVEGSDLSRMVKENGPLPYQEAAEYIRQSALGLQHAHERGLIHRDIKPSNILVSGERALPGSDGVAIVKILDMGLVRSILEGDDGFSRTELTRDGTVVGTPDYMAPEQAKNSSKVDARADLYSLGATLFYLLRGQSPFPEGSPIDKLLRHQLDPPPDLRKLRPDLPVGFVNVINKLLKKKPEERYANAAELAVAIQPYTPGADAGLTFAPAAADRGVSLDLPASQVPAGMQILDAEIVETKAAKTPVTATPVATMAPPARPKPKPPVRKVPAKKIVRTSTLHNSDPISGSMPGQEASPLKVGTTPTRPPTNRTVTDRTPPRNVYKRPTQNPNRRLLGYIFAAAGAIILLVGTIMLFAGGKNKQNTAPPTNSNPAVPNPTPPTVTSVPPAPRGETVLAKSDRVVADNAVAVLVVYPQQFWKRTDWDHAPRRHQSAWLKWLSTNYAFDTRLLDRVTVSLLPRQESFAVGEGSGMTASWIDTLRNSFGVSDASGWRNISLLAPPGASVKDRIFGLLMGTEAIAIGSNRQDIQSFGQRYSLNKTPARVESALLASLPQADDPNPPFVTFAAGKYWRLPETDRRLLMDYGIARLHAVVRLVGNDYEVELTLFGENEKRIKEEFLSLGLATHLTEKYPALRPIQRAITTATPDVVRNGAEVSIKVVAKWPMAEFHAWLEPLLGPEPAQPRTE
jgi:serine/threonine protein kinase